MMFDRGYISPYWPPTWRRWSRVDDAYIFITDKKISVIADTRPLLERWPVRKKKDHYRRGCGGEVLSTLLVNRLRGTLNVVCVKAPASATAAKEMLQISPFLTGGQLIARTGR